MDTSVDTESKLIKVALLVAIGCLIAVHVLHSLLCHCIALLHHAATATLLHPQLPLLPLYPIRHWKLKTFLLLQVAVSVNSPLGCFMLRDDVCPPPSRACWNTYVKVVNCFLSIYNFPLQKSLPHCLYCCFFFPSSVPLCTMQRVGLWNLFCVFLCLLSWNLLIFLCSATSSSFAQESRQYQGYKCPSAPPHHCTNITLIETFTPKPTVACEILSQAATEDLAEGIKAGKDKMCCASGKSLQWL